MTNNRGICHSLPRLRGRVREGARFICARLRGGRAARDSLPPCGGGLGWGVGRRGTAVPHRPTPTPDPSPQGGGEEFAAPLPRNLAPIGAGFTARTRGTAPSPTLPRTRGR